MSHALHTLYSNGSKLTYQYYAIVDLHSAQDKFWLKTLVSTHRKYTWFSETVSADGTGSATMTGQVLKSAIHLELWCTDLADCQIIH